jgi:hypothetical protein
MNVNLDADVGAVNIKDMNMLFYYQIKSLRSNSFFINIPFIPDDFYKYASIYANNEIYRKNDYLFFLYSDA